MTLHSIVYIAYAHVWSFLRCIMALGYLGVHLADAFDSRLRGDLVPWFKSNLKTVSWQNPHVWIRCPACICTQLVVTPCFTRYVRCQASLPVLSCSLAAKWGVGRALSVACGSRRQAGFCSSVRYPAHVHLPPSSGHHKAIEPARTVQVSNDPVACRQPLLALDSWVLLLQFKTAFWSRVVLCHSVLSPWGRKRRRRSSSSEGCLSAFSSSIS